MKLEGLTMKKITILVGTKNNREELGAKNQRKTITIKIMTRRNQRARKHIEDEHDQDREPRRTKS